MDVLRGALAKPCLCMNREKKPMLKIAFSPLGTNEKQQGDSDSMIDFQDPKITDKPWVDALLQKSGYRGCEYNFTNMYVWRGASDQRIARIGDFLIAHLEGGPFGNAYIYPAGEGDVAQVIRAMAEDAKQRGVPFQLVGLTTQHVESLRRLFPGKFSLKADRNSADYLYKIDRLADLPGKKLHAKRNHINRFLENNPNWVYEEITPDSLPECLALEREWYRASVIREDDAQAEDLGDEGRALRLAAAQYRQLGLEGGLLRVDGRLVAFTMGDPITADTFDVHFEKAYGEMQGGFAMINREFARRVRERHPTVKYLNRENDMGIPGLRKAKESYCPDLMVKKYIATATQPGCTL